MAEFLPQGRWAADAPVAGGPLMAAEIAPLRYSLLPSEVERYQSAGRDAEEAVRSVALTVSRGQSENQVAQALMAAAQERGLWVVVCLVAADERIALYRHPLPTDRRIERIAMLVLGAERHGLYVSLSRLVSFGPLSGELKARHLAVCRVDAAFNHGTVGGRTWGDVFREGMAAYAREGLPDEWKLHHQGGPAGYQPREFKVTPAETRRVVENQPAAWNPSITGTKCEDTMLVQTGGNVFLTAARDWPMLCVEAGGKEYLRPDILIR
ncbi:M24 family metallopeptidase [bacterium]|nr:M24 family metallopeptidase [bacterium]